MIFTELTEQQQQNLIKLHSYMVSTYGSERYNTHFNMAYYQAHGNMCIGLNLTKHECGTSACLLGHGPMAGIVKLPNESWKDYALREFGIGWTSLAGSFLFSGDWSSDIQEAITRLRMYIKGFDPTQQEWSFDDEYTFRDYRG